VSGGIDLSKFERAAAAMMNRRASIEEKRAAAKTFLKVFLAYLVSLVCLGWVGSVLLRSVDPTSTLGIVIALLCIVAGLSIMFVFVRAVLRGIFGRSSQQEIGERH